MVEKKENINTRLVTYGIGFSLGLIRKGQKQGWASRPEFRVLSLGLPADTRLLGKTAQTLRFFSRGVER